MRKLSKKQAEIERLSKRLPKPSDSFRKWDMRIRAKNKFKITDEVFESFYSITGEYCVERIFQVGKNYCDEVAQWWTDTETGKTFYRERHSSLIYGGNYGYRFRGYDATSPFYFKQKSGMVDNYGYRFLTPFRRGGVRITNSLKRKGATIDDVETFGIIELSKVLADSRMETILKHSYKDFFWFVYNNRKLTEAIWSAYKISIRHHYRIRNINLWYDMVGEMEYLGMDTHNPKYVCAKAYKRLHDEVVEKANRRRERERKLREEKRRKEIMERNKELVEERVRKYGGLLINNETLHSVVLITYEDYQEEGKAMHHCVGGYFEREDSLILSIRDKDGNRIETVEINLNAFDITQSMGVCNRATPYHREIMSLVNENMWRIRERRLAA